MYVCSGVLSHGGPGVLLQASTYLKLLQCEARTAVSNTSHYTNSNRKTLNPKP